MVDICSCDVHDKEKLALFLHKREEWKRCLLDGSLHSVYGQVTHMLWNDAIFRIFNQARKLTIERNSPTHGFNGPLIRLLDEGFVVSQIMAIRRLTDRNFREQEKAVISLVRVIDDINENIGVITRENYICYDGTSYNEPDSIQDGLKWMHWRCRQINFDNLSGVAEGERARSDKMLTSVVKRLDKELKVCADIRKYANKFIAHASDPQTNPELTEGEKKVTLDKLDACHRVIAQAASFLGAVVLYEYSLGGLPTPQYDHLSNLDKPMVTVADMEKLPTFWSERFNEVAGWHKDYWTKD